jgi:hypothetical protein
VLGLIGTAIASLCAHHELITEQDMTQQSGKLSGMERGISSLCMLIGRAARGVCRIRVCYGGTGWGRGGLGRGWWGGAYLGNDIDVRQVKEGRNAQTGEIVRGQLRLRLESFALPASTHV